MKTDQDDETKERSKKGRTWPCQPQRVACFMFVVFSSSFIFIPFLSFHLLRLRLRLLLSLKIVFFSSSLSKKKNQRPLKLRGADDRLYSPSCLLRPIAYTHTHTHNVRAYTLYSKIPICLVAPPVCVRLFNIRDLTTTTTTTTTEQHTRVCVYGHRNNKTTTTTTTSTSS